MAEKKGTSVFTGVFRIFKRIVLSFLKVIYVVPFFVFGFWLVSVVYFPGFDLNASISLLKYRKNHDVGKSIIRKKETIPKDHFHMIDAYVERPDTKPPVCIDCHGMYAHGKEKKVRAFLNMHAGYISCTVCHVRKDVSGTEGGGIPKNETIEFLWVDRETGAFSNAVKGAYGKYPARIFPVIDSSRGPQRIYTPITEQAAQTFLDTKPGLTPEQLEAARLKLHEAITKEPVTCVDCHKKDGYLEFTKLGFPKRRVDYLVSSEFVGMIDKYKTFYLPSVIDFRGK